MKLVLDVALEKLQSFLGVDRIPAGIEIKKGSNWFSIPDGLARDVVSHSEEIMRMCRYSKCADEVFLQTFVWNSKWREELFSLDVHPERPMEPIEPVEKSMRSSTGKEARRMFGPLRITKSFPPRNDVCEEVRYGCG